MTCTACPWRVAAALLLGLAALATAALRPGRVLGRDPGSPDKSDDAAATAEGPAAASQRPQRPAWVDAPADYSGPIHRIPVGSGPYATPQQARQALDQALQEQLAQYIASQLGDEQAGKTLAYPAATIRRRWVPGDGLFEDTVVSSVGPMHRAFARLELGPEARREIEHRWRKALGRQRLGQLGAVVGVVLGMLASTHLALGLAARRPAAAARLGDHPNDRSRWLRRGWGPTLLVLGGILAFAVVAAGAALWLHWRMTLATLS